MPTKFNRKNWIINQLRRLSLKYPPAIKATNRTKEEYYIYSKKGKPMKRLKFTCASCNKQNLKRSEMNLDHIIPVTENEGFTTWDKFVDGLFCEEENLWLICIPCHEQKTLQENAERGISFQNKGRVLKTRQKKLTKKKF